MPHAKAQGINTPPMRTKPLYVAHAGSFKTKSGISLHERHEHPLVRNAARGAGEGKPLGRQEPKGFGQVWTQDEIERMLALEISPRREIHRSANGQALLEQDD
jgi:hypothetical protein